MSKIPRIRGIVVAGSFVLAPGCLFETEHTSSKHDVVVDAEGSDGCVPDSCEAHGFQCGELADGCGNILICGPPAIRVEWLDYPGQIGPGGCWNSALPYGWGCKNDVPTAPPYADCEHATNVTNGICCREAS